MLEITLVITFCLFIITFWFYRISTTDGDEKYKKLYHFIQFMSFNSVVILPITAAFAYFKDVPGRTLTELLGLDSNLVSDDFLFFLVLMLYAIFTLIAGDFISKKLFILFAQDRIGCVRVEQIIKRPYL